MYNAYFVFPTSLYARSSLFVIVQIFAISMCDVDSDRTDIDGL